MATATDLNRIYKKQSAPQAQGVGSSPLGYQQTYSQGTYGYAAPRSSSSLNPNDYDSLGRRNLPSGVTGYRPDPSLAPPRYEPRPPRPNTPPQNNTPTPSTAQPISKPNNSQIPIANRIGNLANRASNLGERIGSNAGRAAGALAVGSQLVTLSKRPSLATAASAIGGGLLLVPNPYAQGAGLVLSVLGTIGQMFESPENISPNPHLIAPPFTGGQSVGVEYLVNYSSINANGSLYYSDTQQAVGAIAPYSDETGSGFSYDSADPKRFSTNGEVGSVLVINSITRVDGLPDEPIGSDLPAQVINSNESGYAPPNFDDLRERLNGLEDAIQNRNLSDSQKDEIFDALKELVPSANNGVTPRAEKLTPQPLLAPSKSPSTSSSPSRSPIFNYVDADGNPLQNTDINGKPIISKDYVPNKTPTPNQDLTKTPVPDKVPDNLPKTSPATSPTTQDDRFKKPSDCKFSCSALAECFSDVKVLIFDGCNPDTGAARTKEITVQALPKNKANVIATFAELLEIRSRECSLVDLVQTTPEYWSTRVGQIPQAVILFKTTANQENGEPSYYQLQIPHYNGGKNAKPSLPTYQKGEHMAIYECIDGSQMQVYAISDAEALRVINALEKYINPRMRMRDKKNIKTGKRGGFVKVQVKPIRLDFSSTGQARKSPDWSISL